MMIFLINNVPKEFDDIRGKNKKMLMIIKV